MFLVDHALKDKRIGKVVLKCLFRGVLRRVNGREDSVIVYLFGRHMHHWLNDDQTGKVAGLLGCGAHPRDVLQTELFKRHHLRCLFLDVLQNIRDRLLLAELYADRHCRYCGSGHTIKSGDWRMSARDRRAEADVVSVAVPC